MLPLLVVKNTTNAAVTATPTFHEFEGEGGNAVQLPSVSLGPYEAKAVDLQPLVAAAASEDKLKDVSVEIGTDAMPGGLIGALAAVTTDGARAYDVPLRDSGPVRQATGSYPWRLDGDYSTRVTITNVSTTPARFHGRITYSGGEHVIQTTNLAVAETAVFDLGALRKAGRIAANATGGQFRWSIVQGGGQTKLNGRAEIVSVAEDRSSSYSCGVCCPDSYNWSYLDPFTVAVPTGYTGDAQILANYQNCYGGSAGWYWAEPTWWDIQYTSVTDAHTVQNGLGRMDGLDNGWSGVAGRWDADRYQENYEFNTCDYIPITAEAPGVAEVACSTPVNFRRTAAADLGGGTLRVEYSWDASMGNLSTLNSCFVGEYVTYPFCHFRHPSRPSVRRTPQTPRFLAPVAGHPMNIRHRVHLGRRTSITTS